MCTGLPARVLSVTGSEARVDSGDGRARIAGIAAPEAVRSGDYVLLYADLIVRKIDRRSALEILQDMKEMAVRAAGDDGESPGEVSARFDTRLKGLSGRTRPLVSSSPTLHPHTLASRKRHNDYP